MRKQREVEVEAHAQANEFDDDAWLTIEQVAKHFNCPPARVREWIAQGLLTPQPFGSIERIKRNELDLIGNHEVEAAQEFEKDHR